MKNTDINYIVFEQNAPAAEKIKVLKEIIEELEKTEEPKEWCVYGDGIITEPISSSTINLYDKMGLAFYTEAEAYQKVEELKLLKEVKDYIHKANDGKEPYDGKDNYWGVFTYKNNKQIQPYLNHKVRYRFINKNHAEEFGNLFYDRLLKFNLI
jgi:hypothetical protein